MSDAEHAAARAAMAAEDFRLAREIATAFPRQAAYHLQQGAEKAAKALLVHAGIDPERIHQTGQLAQALPTRHPLRKTLIGLDRLTIYGTALRYPNPARRLPEPPHQDQLERDIADVAGLIDRVRGHLKARPVRRR